MNAPICACCRHSDPRHQSAEPRRCLAVVLVNGTWANCDCSGYLAAAMDEEEIQPALELASERG